MKRIYALGIPIALAVVLAFVLAGCGSSCGGSSGGGGGINFGGTFLGVAMVGRPEGASATGGSTDVSVIKGLNTTSPVSSAANTLPTPQSSVDTFALSSDATVGLVGGEDTMCKITGINTVPSGGTPVIGTAVSADDGGSASGFLVHSDNTTGLLAAPVVSIPHRPDTATPVQGAVFSGGFRTGNDASVNSEDQTVMVIGSAGHGFSSGLRSSYQVILAANTNSPTVGATINLPSGQTDAGYEGNAGMSMSPADKTRMCIATNGTVEGVVLVTGLTTTPVVGPVVAVPGLVSGDKVRGCSISRDGKFVAVETMTSVIGFSGVDTGTLTPISNLLVLDASGGDQNGNLGIHVALDDSAVFINNNRTGSFFVVRGHKTTTLSLSATLPLLPSEPGRQDDNALLLH